MCNSGVTVRQKLFAENVLGRGAWGALWWTGSGAIRGKCVSTCFPIALLELVHRRRNVLSVRVRVTLYHLKRLVPGDPLDCRQVNARLHEVRDRRVS